MNLLVSIIVPIYKVEDYLDRCIESIICQTYNNLEIILVEDGSPDTCPWKCDMWEKTDKRIRVIHKKNGGLASARNAGLDVITGDYIVFVDADDYIAQNAIEIMVKRIENDKSDLVITKWTTVYENGQYLKDSCSWLKNSVITRDEAMRMIGAMNQRMPVFAWGKLYRACIFDKIRFGSLKCGEDLYVLPDIINSCNKVSIESTVTYFYVQRSESIMHNRTYEVKLDNIVAYIHVIKYLMDMGYLQGAQGYYYSLLRSIDVKNVLEVKKMLNDSFDKNELSLLRTNINLKQRLFVLFNHFPKILRFYESIKKK